MIIVIVLVVIAVFCFVMTNVVQKKSDAEIKALNESIFKNKCYLEKISSLETERDIEKAYLIAESLNLKRDLNYLKTILEREKANPMGEYAKLSKDYRMAIQKIENEKKEEERKLFNSLNCFSSYSGREKRIAMLTARMNEAKSSAESLRNGTRAIVGATQQREHDWAVHGGLAQGIAGPAAGVVTALDIQAKNAAIRAQNSANLKAAAPLIVKSYSSAAQYDSKAASLEAEIAQAKLKLVSKASATDCLNNLSFTNTYARTSETGTVTVYTTAKVNKPIEVYDNPNAVIDGTIIARILDDGKEIGKANLVLPLYGISKDESVGLKGMCLNCGTQHKLYNIKLDANNLWIMER